MTNFLLTNLILVSSIMFLWAMIWIMVFCAADSTLLKIVAVMLSGPIGWVLLGVALIVISVNATVEKYLSKPFRDLDRTLCEFESRWSIFKRGPRRRHW